MKSIVLPLLAAVALVSCQEEAKVAPAPAHDYRAEIGALREQITKLESQILREQNQRNRESAEHTAALRDLQGLIKELVKPPRPEPPIIVATPAIKADVEAEEKAREEKEALDEVRRTVRLKAQGENHPFLRTVSGKDYFDLVINRVSDIGVTFRHRGGIARVDFEDLPEGWKDRFYYDEERAALAIKHEKIARARYERAVADQAQTKEQKEKEAARDQNLAQLAQAGEDLKRTATGARNTVVGERLVVNPPVVVHDPRIYDEDNCPPVVQTPVVRPHVIRPTKTTPIIRGGEHVQSSGQPAHRSGFASHSPGPTSGIDGATPDAFPRRDSAGPGPAFAACSAKIDSKCSALDSAKIHPESPALHSNSNSCAPARQFPAHHSPESVG